MAAYDIRIIGDPVLREVATDVTDIDGALVKVVEGMVEAMYQADGLAVAAPQVGVRKRLVVSHLPDDPEPLTIVNPRIEEHGDDEWLYSEGCLSIPGLYWEIARPKTVHVVGLDLDGNEVSIEADELAARMYQHEIDHLDGVLMTERLDDDQKVEAKRAVRELMLARSDHVASDRGPASLLPLTPPEAEPVSVTPAVPPRRPRRLVFLGTPAASVPALQALVAAGFDVALVVSQPDRRRGRGGARSPSPVKSAAVELGLPVTDRVDDARSVGADLGVVVAYGEILRADLLAALPMVNIHFSLLPRWRGAAPVERALLAGDPTTGVCVMEVVEALDAGGVHAVAEVPIGPDATAVELRQELAEVGARLLVDTLTAGLGEPTPQDGEPTYAQKIRPGDLHLDWERTAVDLHRVVRVGGAWTTFRGRRLRVWEAHVGPSPPGAAPGTVHRNEGAVTVATGDGVLVLDEVQPEGKGRVLAPAWANGARPTDGEVLGS